MHGRPKRQPKRKALIIGLGLDNRDGHVRYTKGPNFHLFGGSQETHEEMQEKAIRINEQLRSRGKKLEDVSRDEFREIAESVGLRPPTPEQREPQTREDTKTEES